MNLKEQIEQIKKKYDSVSTNWDKLTVEEIMRIEEFLAGFVKPDEPIQTTSEPLYHRPYINDSKFDEITMLRSKGYSWIELAKRYGYANSASISTSYYLFRSKREQKLSQQTNVSVPPADGAPIV